MQSSLTNVNAWKKTQTAQSYGFPWDSMQPWQNRLHCMLGWLDDGRGKGKFSFIPITHQYRPLTHQWVGTYTRQSADRRRQRGMSVDFAEDSIQCKSLAHLWHAPFPPQFASQYIAQVICVSLHILRLIRCIVVTFMEWYLLPAVYGRGLPLVRCAMEVCGNAFTHKHFYKNSRQISDRLGPFRTSAVYHFLSLWLLLLVLCLQNLTNLHNQHPQHFAHYKKENILT